MDPDPSKKTGLVLVDDHELFREGLSEIIKIKTDFTILAQSSTVAGGLLQIELHNPAVVITDLTFPEENGMDLVKSVARSHPSIHIIVFTVHENDLYAERLFRSGARGYVSKTATLEELIKAINTVLRGEVYASPKICNAILGRMTRASESTKKGEMTISRALSHRELQIFELVGKGMGNQEISSILGISTRTVDSHKTHIKSKLNLPDNNQLTSLAVRWSIDMVNH